MCQGPAESLKSLIIKTCRGALASAFAALHLDLFRDVVFLGASRSQSTDRNYSDLPTTFFSDGDGVAVCLRASNRKACLTFWSRTNEYRL